MKLTSNIRARSVLAVSALFVAVLGGLNSGEDRSALAPSAAVVSPAALPCSAFNDGNDNLGHGDLGNDNKGNCDIGNGNTSNFSLGNDNGPGADVPSPPGCIESSTDPTC